MRAAAAATRASASSNVRPWAAAVVAVMVARFAAAPPRPRAPRTRARSTSARSAASSLPRVRAWAMSADSSGLRLVELAGAEGGAGAAAQDVVSEEGPVVLARRALGVGEGRVGVAGVGERAVALVELAAQLAQDPAVLAAGGLERVVDAGAGRAEVAALDIDAGGEDQPADAVGVVGIERGGGGVEVGGGEGQLGGEERVGLLNRATGLAVVEGAGLGDPAEAGEEARAQERIGVAGGFEDGEGLGGPAAIDDDVEGAGELLGGLGGAATGDQVAGGGEQRVERIGERRGVEGVPGDRGGDGMGGAQLHGLAVAGGEQGERSGAGQRVQLERAVLAEIEELAAGEPADDGVAAHVGDHPRQGRGAGGAAEDGGGDEDGALLFRQRGGVPRAIAGPRKAGIGAAERERHAARGVDVGLGGGDRAVEVGEALPEGAGVLGGERAERDLGAADPVAAERERAIGHGDDAAGGGGGAGHAVEKGGPAGAEEVRVVDDEEARRRREGRFEGAGDHAKRPLGAAGEGRERGVLGGGHDGGAAALRAHPAHDLAGQRGLADPGRTDEHGQRLFVDGCMQGIEVARAADERQRLGAQGTKPHDRTCWRCSAHGEPLTEQAPRQREFSPAMS